MPFASFWPWSRPQDNGPLGRQQKARSHTNVSRLEKAKSSRKSSHASSEQFIDTETLVKPWFDRLPFRKSSGTISQSLQIQPKIEVDTENAEPLITQNNESNDAQSSVFHSKPLPSHDDIPLMLEPSQLAISSSVPTESNSLDTTKSTNFVTRIPSASRIEHTGNIVLDHTVDRPTRSAASFTPSIPVERSPNVHDYNPEGSAFEHERMTISNRRNNNLSLQAKIHEKRVILREKQNAKSALENNLIQRIRMQELGFLRETVNDQRSIMDILQEFQAARDTYGPLEDECNELENYLAREEFELYQQEEEFYQNWEFQPISRFKHYDEPTRYEHESSSEIPLSGYEQEPTYHPLVEKYLEKKGDLEILEEELDDLKDERTSIQDHMESRSLVGLSLTSEEQIWLDNSQKGETDLLFQIHRLEQEVGELKNLCYEMKLVDEDGDPTDWKSITVKEDSDIKPELSIYSKFSNLLPEQNTNSDILQEYAPILAKEEAEQLREKPSEQTPRQTALQINIWSLRILLASAMDVKLLDYFLSRYKRHLTPKMQHLALRTWFTDVENTPTRRRYQPSRSESMTTQAPRQPEFAEQLGLLPDSSSAKAYRDISLWRRESNSTGQTDIEDVGSVGRSHFLF